MSNWDIEVSEKMYHALSSIFKTLDLSVPDKITSSELELALTQMKDIMTKTKVGSNYLPNSDIKISSNIDKALVISRLGVIRYQLKVILSQLKIEAVALENPYTALAEYVKRLYALVIIDIADNVDDTLEIIKEIKRLSISQNVFSIIIVLSNPLLESNIRNLLLSKGIDKIIDKKEFWYDDVTKELKNISINSF